MRLEDSKTRTHVDESKTRTHVDDANETLLLKTLEVIEQFNNVIVSLTSRRKKNFETTQEYVLIQAKCIDRLAITVAIRDSENSH